MSFYRLIFYSAVVGGWAAFVGWLIAELVLLRRGDAETFGVVAIFLATAIVGAAIAGGLSLLAGAANGQLKQQLPRALVGACSGFVGGAAGGRFGALIYQLYAGSITFALGWTVMGLAIGSVEGLYDRSPKKIRNGLIGGGLGGFLAGLLFHPIHAWIGGQMSSRATAFVILGIFIGLFIGLAQVILKDAWLTVVEGFRPGRQLILNRPETLLGTSEKAQLPFIAFGAKGVEPVHVRILQQPDGTFLLQDNNSRTGTQVNGQRIQAVVLRNGDIIQLGPNAVRYSESVRRSDRTAAVPPPAGGRPASRKEEVVEAVLAGPPPASPRPVVRRPASDIQVGAPAGPPPSRPSPAGAVMPSRPPAPPPVPKAPPQPAPAPPAAAEPAVAACPICARPAKGPAGKRLCQNCGIRF